MDRFDNKNVDLSALKKKAFNKGNLDWENTR